MRHKKADLLSKNETPVFCPYCGYLLNMTGSDILACHKCHKVFVIKMLDYPDDTHEIWYDILPPLYRGRYQVSSCLRVRSMDRTTADKRLLSGKIMATYQKNNELYVSLSADGQHKEYNVRTLYMDAIHEESRKERYYE